MAHLDIDTDQLRSAVTVAEKANEEITEAMNLLNRIVEHKDWVCKERNSINNNTVYNKETAKQIQGKSNAFYQAIKQASDMFDQVEQDNIKRTNQVDGLIGEMTSVTLGAFGAAGDSPSVVSFDDVKNSMEG